MVFTRFALFCRRNRKIKKSGDISALEMPPKLFLNRCKLFYDILQYPKRILHTFHILSDRFCGIPAILGNKLHNGGAYDGAVGY